MSHVTRRSFLEQSLYAAAAGLAAVSSARAAEHKNNSPTTRPTTRPSRAPANNRLGVAVIGFGPKGRGHAHIDYWASRSDEIDIVALCDIDQHNWKAAQAKLDEKSLPPAKFTQDLREVFDNKDVHAVSIATPNHWHALAAIWAMQAGKDVYVEKPASHNIFEGQQMIAAQQRHGRICQLGTQARSSKSVRQAMEYIRSGGIGKVLLSRALCYKKRDSIGHYADAPVPQGVEYDIWLGPAPKRPFNKNRFHYQWHWNWDYGNGDIGNQGIHQMDLARWALGRELPTSVVSLGGRFGYRDDGQTPNTQLALFDYGDSHLLFEVRGLKTPGLMGVSVGNIVYGTNGFVAFGSEYHNDIVAFDNKGKKVKSFTGGGDHFGNFLEAVRSRKQSDLHAPIAEGHLSTALCHLANTSYRLGTMEPFSVPLAAYRAPGDLMDAFGRMEQHLADSLYTDGSGKDAKQSPMKLQEMQFQLGPTLAFDPHTQTFPYNRDANEMLTREYRAPFVVPQKV